VNTDAPPEIEELTGENAGWRRANKILKSALTFFAAKLDRPHLGW